EARRDGASLLRQVRAVVLRAFDDEREATQQISNRTRSDPHPWLLSATSKRAPSSPNRTATASTFMQELSSVRARSCEEIRTFVQALGLARLFERSGMWYGQRESACQWRPVPRAQRQVPGAQRQVPGAQRQVPGARRPVPRAQRQVPGAQRQVPGA